VELNQAQMLAEAVPAALGGQRVLVLTFNQEHSRFLLTSARSSLSSEHIQRIENNLLRFPSGGLLKFLSLESTKSQENLRGHEGPVYVLSQVEYGEDRWELCTTYIREPHKIVKPEKVKPRTRFERILEDDD
jgi:hypothetical protein